MFRVSIKGVLLVDGKAVLVRNDRRGWELPGGGLEIGETPEETLEREFEEELAVKVEPLRLLDSYLFEVIAGRHVFIVTYGCRLRGEFKPALSEEHSAFGLYAPEELGSIELPPGYARSVRSWSRLA
ncbi:MAG TPA: NUDIX domain-containing protein [Burkholderiales bacterium]|jgi:8-oxo-dGTP pyrophosphatase MutT (NUDIX family)|nr:NUDIX domain-containing protein [Burkholderiales bacterium]